MIISVDTEVMLNMASLASSSYTEVEQCSALADTITTHNGWNCKERDLINEKILDTKKRVHQLFENIETFSKALNSAAARFQDTENEYIRLIQNLDCTIGGALSAVPVCATVSPTMADVASYLSESTNAAHGIESYSVGNLADSIQLCEFSDIDFQNRG